MAAVPPLSPQDRAAQRAVREERRNEAIKLSVAGFTYDEIAVRLGYNSKQAAHKDVKAALAERRARTALSVEEYVEKNLAILESAIKTATEIMHKDHLAHGNGRIVRREIEQPDGSVILEDVLDDGPRLAAASALIRASESMRKLLGLDAPAKQQIEASTTVQYNVAVTPEEMEAL